MVKHGGNMLWKGFPFRNMETDQACEQAKSNQNTARSKIGFSLQETCI